MDDLWGEIRETMRTLDEVMDKCAEIGERLVSAEAAYYTAKAKATFELKEQGYAATLIQQIVKGVDSELARKYRVTEVSEAMTDYHRAEVEYENAKEARNVCKKKLAMLNDQYNREWNSGGYR